MPSSKTVCGVFAVLSVVALVATPASASSYGYPLLAKAVPVDLGPDTPPDDLPDDDKGVLTAHVTMPDSVDKACRAAANQSNGGNEGTIVVCSHGGDTSDQRVAPSRSVDESTRDGALHPPDVSGLPGCIGPCVTIRIGHVPPPVYYIDLSTIPEAPEGSDAAKIGKGEMRAR